MLGLNEKLFLKVFCSVGLTMSCNPSNSQGESSLDSSEGFEDSKTEVETVHDRVQRYRNAVEELRLFSPNHADLVSDSGYCLDVSHSLLTELAKAGFPVHLAETSIQGGEVIEIDGEQKRINKIHYFIVDPTFSESSGDDKEIIIDATFKQHFTPKPTDIPHTLIGTIEEASVVYGQHSEKFHMDVYPVNFEKGRDSSGDPHQGLYPTQLTTPMIYSSGDNNKYRLDLPPPNIGK